MFKWNVSATNNDSIPILTLATLSQKATSGSFDGMRMLRTSYCKKKPFQQKPQSLVRPLRLFKVVENKSFILEHSKNMFPK